MSKKIKNGPVDPKYCFTRSEYARGNDIFPSVVTKMANDGDLTIVLINGADLIYCEKTTGVLGGLKARKGKKINLDKSKTNEEVRKICNWFTNTMRPKAKASLTDADKVKWIDTIEKCRSIDKFSYEEIFNIVKWARTDWFWSKQFNSLLKLRSKGQNQSLTYIFRWEEEISGHVGKTQSPDEKEDSDF